MEAVSGCRVANAEDMEELMRIARRGALWEVQLEEFPDSIRCSRQEVMNTWILQGTTQFKADPRLQHGILNALLNDPTGIFYTCNDGRDYGYRYGSGGGEYSSFYVEV